MSKNVVEAKVYAATLGGGAGTILSQFLLWVLGVLFWHASGAAEHAVAAAAAVPQPVAGLIDLILAVGGAFLGGYLAPHTPRSELLPVPEPVPEPPIVLETTVAETF